jgi:tetratricopeptide (TPR) repeat protein
MKSINLAIFLVFLLPILLKAQHTLSFDKLFVECEDKWVTFDKNEEGVYNFGFIYIDSQAGLTFDFAGHFTIEPNGKFVPTKVDTASIKYRLTPNQVRVALIPENKFIELQISDPPDWLKFYKSDTASVERLYRWGYLYNGWDQCAKALTYLEKAKKIDPTFKGLEVELAFSYNCLGQYNKAVIELTNIIERSPKDAYVNKELVYSLVKSGQLESASIACKKAIKVCKDKTYNGENCYNLLHEYYKNKDKTNFNHWLKETKKWNKENVELTNSIKAMEYDLNK